MLFYECFVYVSKAFYEVRLGFVGRMEDLERGAIKKCFCIHGLVVRSPFGSFKLGLRGLQFISKFRFGVCYAAVA